MGLYEKMYNVMCEAESIEKNLNVGTGTSSYKAVGEAEVLNKLKPLFKQYKLIVFPTNGEVREHVSTFETDYKGTKQTKARNITQIHIYFKKRIFIR